MKTYKDRSSFNKHVLTHTQQEIEVVDLEKAKSSQTGLEAIEVTN